MSTLRRLRTWLAPLALLFGAVLLWVWAGLVLAVAILETTR